MSAITSYFVLNITSSFLKGFFGQMSNGGLIIFAAMGVIGGLSGALFNTVNEKLTQFRIRKLSSKFSKVAEVMVCGITVSTLAFAMMYSIDDCRAYDVDINRAPVRLFLPRWQSLRSGKLMV